jgi:TolB protein
MFLFLSFHVADGLAKQAACQMMRNPLGILEGIRQMKQTSIIARVSFFFLMWVVFVGCAVFPSANIDESPRGDGAYRVEIPGMGSFQNPAWSPDGQSILVTRFRNGYNMEPADILIIDLHSNDVRILVSDGSANINLPGASWNEHTGQIVFSSARDPHDEIFIIDEEGKTAAEVRITYREELVAHEASFSPSGEWIVFESHRLDVKGNGVITRYKIDGTEPYRMLTGMNDDCRQPNWSPAGDLIVYQSFSGWQWDIWVMNTDGTGQRKITSGVGDKTDASFSPDGDWVVYSYQEPEKEGANLYIAPASGGNPIRVTSFEGYDGAASWSPDGDKIVFESGPEDPDDSAGTAIWVIDIVSY